MENHYFTIILSVLYILNKGKIRDKKKMYLSLWFLLLIFNYNRKNKKLYNLFAPFFLLSLLFVNNEIKNKRQKIILNEEEDKKNKINIFRENLEIFDSIMKKNNIFYWVGEGTALGFLRDGDFIPGDTDVDVGIWFKDKLKFSIIVGDFIREGFAIMRHLPYSLKRKSFYIDIDFTALNTPAMAYKWPNISNNFINLIKPFRKININGRYYNIPSQKYIEYLYTSDWKIPLSRKPNSYNKYNEKINMRMFKLLNLHYIYIQELICFFSLVKDCGYLEKSCNSWIIENLKESKGIKYSLLTTIINFFTILPRIQGENINKNEILNTIKCNIEGKQKEYFKVFS